MEKHSITAEIKCNAVNEHLVKELVYRQKKFVSLLSELQEEIGRFGIEKINSEYFKDLIKLSFDFTPDELDYLKENICNKSKKDKKVIDGITQFIRSLNLYFNLYEENNND